MPVFASLMGNGKKSTAPGAASSGPGRRALISFAGRSAVLRRGRCEPALLRVAPKDAVAVPSLAATAACLATWAGGLLFGDDGVTGLRCRHARGCLPRSRDHLGRHDSFGFDQGLCFVPSCPVNVPKVSRGCRPAVFDAHAAGAYGPAHGASVDSPPPPEMRQRGQSVPAGASPRTTPECVTIPEAAPGRRQPQATTAAPVPDSRRLSGCPVWPRWLPTHRPRAAPNGREYTPGTKAAPEQNV